ncbi:hypothetical protein O4H49_03240 [Kiloniella laminariae]|uniref:Uncharacterized protein n=1 Tax=Kiloniella laminariae TaxID=454162 RepID=A0ABT4LF90_9PROT|nr:hypothetical protein [Kiloniella laminariae]MCZ4279778.1 hypothetical protein [Kiloniella laminariae]
MTRNSSLSDRIPPTQRERMTCGLVMAGIVFPALSILSFLLLVLNTSSPTEPYVSHYVIIPILMLVGFLLAYLLLPFFFFRDNSRVFVPFIGGFLITVAAGPAAAFLNGLLIVVFLEAAAGEVSWVGKWEAEGLAFWFIYTSFVISVFFSPVIGAVAIYLNRRLSRQREENAPVDSNVFE